MAGLCFAAVTAFGQSHRHWVRSFNEESSLLSGAVVGGGVGPSAIYFNPAAIADVENSSLSLHASLFSLEFFNVKNALGDDIDLSSTRGLIQPRFISYLLQPERNPDFSIELAYLNNELYHLEFTRVVDKNIDILGNFEGKERYFGLFRFLDRYRDDWVGIGASWKISEALFLGGSMFTIIRTLDYQTEMNLQAFPAKDSLPPNQEFYSAQYQQEEFYHFNDYRLIWKASILFKKETYSLGLTVRTPSIHVYSDGKRIYRKESRTNITRPFTGEFLQDQMMIDYKEKKEVSVNLKDPFSVAAGLTLHLDRNDQKVLYTTVEYFHKLDEYDVVSAEVSSALLMSEENDPGIPGWLTYQLAAKPVFNAAIGYRWRVNEDLMILTGFRTDFNYLKEAEKEGGFRIRNNMKLDVYHLTGGFRWRVLGQDLITGLQYSFGLEKEQLQIANLADPLEYNPIGGLPLQGVRKFNMDAWYNAVIFYFGATFNFGKKKGS